MLPRVHGSVGGASGGSVWIRSVSAGLGFGAAAGPLRRRVNASVDRDDFR